MVNLLTYYNFYFTIQLDRFFERGNKMSDQKAIAVLSQYALVPTNEGIVAISKRFGWKPKTLIRRIEKSLKTVMEQQVYMMIGKDFGIQPESMKKLLRIFLGKKNLEMEDLVSVSVGENLVFSPFKLFAEYLRESLMLLRMVDEQYSSFSLCMEQAGLIVLNYGEDSERFIEMVDNNLDEWCFALGVGDNRPNYERVRLCIWNLITNVMTTNHENGCPEILNPSDLSEMKSDGRRYLRLAVSDEIPDYLSGIQTRMGSCEDLVFLKSLGVI